MQPPDHRLQLAEASLEAGDSPGDPWAERARAHLDGSAPDADVAAALDILESPDQRLRGALEAYLLASADAAAICERFTLPGQAVQAYRKLCFDLDGLSAGDRGLVAHDPEQPDVVRELRLIGHRHGVALLDHVLGIQPSLDEGQQQALHQQLVSKLLARALCTDHLDQLNKLVGMLVKLQPDQPEQRDSEVSEAVQRMIDAIDDPPVPRGLSNLDEVIALPKRTA